MVNTMDSKLYYICTLLFACCSLNVPSVEAGECCNSYEDALTTEHSAQYCPDYCCGTPLVKLYCCSNAVLRTGEDNRDDFCMDWFGDHFYVPIVVVVLIIALVTCCCCACRRRRQGVIIQTQQPATLLIHQQQTTTQDPYRAGYNQ
ncbi:uncharacterized protein LOC143085190 isoform X1 [Mytilus galloprovincialis]|uniref:uncharacterized protein LOC143085190 isoform X1 n=1 Tax=Mytilus galloprovincialis TaxID=29158 RepID=UPI003F7BA752